MGWKVIETTMKTMFRIAISPTKSAIVPDNHISLTLTLGQFQVHTSCLVSSIGLIDFIGSAKFTIQKQTDYVAEYMSDNGTVHE